MSEIIVSEINAGFQNYCQTCKGEGGKNYCSANEPILFTAECDLKCKRNLNRCPACDFCWSCNLQ